MGISWFSVWAYHKMDTWIEMWSYVEYAVKTKCYTSWNSLFQSDG